MIKYCTSNMIKFKLVTFFSISCKYFGKKPLFIKFLKGSGYHFRSTVSLGTIDAITGHS